MPVPIFNRNQGSIMRAQQEIIAARNALAQVELSLQNRLAPTFEQYQNARNQVVRYRKKILPTAQRSLDLTRNMYKAGELNYVGFLTAQRTFTYTHLNYLDALRALRTSEVELEGLLLRGSLDFRSSTSAPPELYERFRSAPIGGVELFR
jgi:cobalt-zinc-cadmium efflux system outer membrane protein